MANESSSGQIRVHKHNYSYSYKRKLVNTYFTYHVSSGPPTIIKYIGARCMAYARVNVTPCISFISKLLSQTKIQIGTKYRI